MKSKTTINSILLRASLLIILCLLVQATTVFGLNFNVTLGSLTNHNTSADSAYNQSNFGANFGTTTWVNQNGTTMPVDPSKMDESLNPITPGHVSHTDVHGLIPNRPDLRWFANGTCWWGNSSHINIGINDNTTAQVAAEISDLESRGFNGIIFSWYGQGSYEDSVALKVQQYLHSSSNTNKNFKMIIMVVYGDFTGGEGVPNLEANINYCQSQYFSDTNYECEPVNTGKPILMFFNVYNYNTNYNTAAKMLAIKNATTGTSALWVQEDTSEITASWVDQTYLWTDDFAHGINPADPYNLHTATNQFATIKANNTKQAFGAMCAHFNGTLTKSTNWSLGKYLPSSNGLCEVTRAGVYNTMMPANMTRMQWATWSDWEEGTECMSGTENNFALTTAMNTNVLAWTITSGDERTIDHYDVYALTNGGNAAFLCAVPNGIHQTNVTQLGLFPGSYQLYVNAVAKACIRDHLSSAVSFVVTQNEAQNLPDPWLSQDIGNVGVSGSANYTNGSFTISGSGADIWGSHDSFQFASQPWSGDGQIVVRVASMQNTDPWAKAAIMFRETLDDDSVNALICVTPGSGISMQSRTTTTGSTATINTVPGTAPKWISLIRLGNTLTGYQSSDGVTWTPVGTNTVPMATNLYVGLAVTSKSNSTLNTAVFDHVSVGGVWFSAGIGGGGVGSQINYSNGVVTLQGAGFDIWGSGDAFQYLYQAASGDRSIIARVTGVQGTAPWAKAALMIRETLATNSRNTILFLSPSNGVQIQGRTATGGSTVSITNITGLVAPQWLQLVRSGANMNAYISRDGVSWVWVGTQSNSMATSYYIGLADTSKNTAQTNTSTFDHVSIQDAWASGDIGSVGVPGSASVVDATGVFTVSGSGTDIWSTADAFQFVDQPLYGNGQIVARVLSVQNTSPWAKAGVMIRDTETAGAANGLLFISPTNGVSFQGRTSTGGSTATFQIATGITTPWWLKLVRSGTSLTAFQSGDGATWTQVSTAQTISISTNAWVGLAVGSKTNTVLNTSTFDNVTVTPTP